MSLDAIFGATGHVDTAQECARAVLVFAYGLVLVRVSGRRVFGKWSALDIIVSIMVGSNLSRALTGGAPLFSTIAATTAVMALHWLFALASARWPALSHIVEGRPTELGRDGSIDHAARVRHAVSEADLNEALRQRGVTDVKQTHAITLEPSGNITVLK